MRSSPLRTDRVPVRAAEEVGAEAEGQPGREPIGQLEAGQDGEVQGVGRSRRQGADRSPGQAGEAPGPVVEVPGRKRGDAGGDGEFERDGAGPELGRPDPADPHRPGDALARRGLAGRRLLLRLGRGALHDDLDQALVDPAADDAAVFQGVADEIPFAFFLVRFEHGAFGDLLDDGAADIGLFPEVGLLGRDLDLRRTGRSVLGLGGER